MTLHDMLRNLQGFVLFACQKDVQNSTGSIRQLLYSLKCLGQKFSQALPHERPLYFISCCSVTPKRLSQDRKSEKIIEEEMDKIAQARFDVERQREGAQRQLAALDGKLRKCSARCEEAEAQAEGTRRQLALEGTRVAELEALLARVRASHFEAARLPGGVPGPPAHPPGPDHAAFRRCLHWQ